MRTRIDNGSKRAHPGFEVKIWCIFQGLEKEVCNCVIMVNGKNIFFPLWPLPYHIFWICQQKIVCSTCGLIVSCDGGYPCCECISPSWLNFWARRAALEVLDTVWNHQLMPWWRLGNRSVENRPNSYLDLKNDWFSGYVELDTFHYARNFHLIRGIHFGIGHWELWLPNHLWM